MKLFVSFHWTKSAFCMLTVSVTFPRLWGVWISRWLVIFVVVEVRAVVLDVLGWYDSTRRLLQWTWPLRWSWRRCSRRRSKARGWMFVFDGTCPGRAILLMEIWNWDWRRHHPATAAEICWSWCRWIWARFRFKARIAERFSSPFCF